MRADGSELRRVVCDSGSRECRVFYTQMPGGTGAAPSRATIMCETGIVADDKILVRGQGEDAGCDDGGRRHQTM